jgi:hypothetical protein
MPKTYSTPSASRQETISSAVVALAGETASFTQPSLGCRRAGWRILDLG